MSDNFTDVISDCHRAIFMNYSTISILNTYRFKISFNSYNSFYNFAKVMSIKTTHLLL